MEAAGFWTESRTWVAVAFFLFFIIFGKKLWQAVAGMLDSRAEAVRRELAEATQLREEAEQMLTEARCGESRRWRTRRLWWRGRGQRPNGLRRRRRRTRAPPPSDVSRWRWTVLPPRRRPRWMRCGWRRRMLPRLRHVT